MSMMMKLKKFHDSVDTFDVIMKSFEDGTLRDDVTGELIKSVDVALVEAVTASGMTLNKAMKPRDLMKLKQYGVSVSELNKAIEVATTKKVCYSSAVDNALYALKNQSIMLTDEEIAGRIDIIKSALGVMSDGEIKDLVFTTLDKLKAMKSLEDDAIWKMQDVIRSMIRVSLEMNKAMPDRSFLRVLHKGKMYDKVDGEYVPFCKAKYLRREGTPGHYRYTYANRKGGNQVSASKPDVIYTSKNGNTVEKTRSYPYSGSVYLVRGKDGKLIENPDKEEHYTSNHTLFYSKKRAIKLANKNEGSPGY